MDEKISLKAVEQYSEAYSSKIVSRFFASREKISGTEIVSLCEIKQVNLFVLRELMRVWKVESQKLKSPYFNYQSAEVIQSLEHFQNTLSNHILISKNDFVPLLKRAITQTLLLILDPYDFYSDALDHQGHGSINVAELRSDIKYLKINRQPMEDLVQKLEQKKITTLLGNEAFALLDSILEEVSFTPEDIDAYLAQFSKTVPLELEKLYEQKNSPKTNSVTVKPAPEKKPEPITAVSREPKRAVNNFQKIGQIRDILTINQKFMFTKILFNGDFEIFSQSIERLDSFDNLAQALNYLEEKYPEWDKESEEYQEFRDMVEKRFA